MTEDVLNMVALADELEAIILDVVPGCQTLQKYGGTLFTLRPEEKEGQFCGVFVHKKHVQISFSKGAELKDPSSLLLGTGKYRRHINVTTSIQASDKAVRKLLKQASGL